MMIEFYEKWNKREKRRISDNDAESSLFGLGLETMPKTVIR